LRPPKSSSSYLYPHGAWSHIPPGLLAIVDEVIE